MTGGRQTLVGLDVGGTYLRVAVSTAEVAGEISHMQMDNPLWDSLRSPDRRAALLANAVRAVVPDPKEIKALVVGARGVDTLAAAQTLRAALRERLPGVAVDVVNDALLVAFADGSPDALAVVAGTGSVVCGRDDEGQVILANGWGWLVGDDGSAPRIVLDALTLLTRILDEGGSDPLTDLMRGHFDVADLRELPEVLPPRLEEVAALAPIIFQAADVGSVAADVAIRANGDALASSVAAALTRGARARSIVVSGGVITHQERLRSALQEGLRRRDLQFTVRNVSAPPVLGALQLALELASDPTGASV